MIPLGKDEGRNRQEQAGTGRQEFFKLPASQVQGTSFRVVQSDKKTRKIDL
jgi:hypothetical protein